MHIIATHDHHVTYVWRCIHIGAEAAEDVSVESEAEYINEPKPVEPVENQGRLLSISLFYNCIFDYVIHLYLYACVWIGYYD